MKKTTLLIFAFLCVIINQSFAQRPGYIITLKNDTIRGEAKTTIFVRVKFKPANTRDFTNINPDTIKEYQLTNDSSVFIVKSLPTSSMNLSSKPQFVQRLEHGKINLYEKVSSDRYRLRTWYVSKTTDSLIAIKTDDTFLVGGGSKKSRKELLANMFSDQPDVFAAFNTKDKFDFDTIQLFIHRYNQTSAQK